MSFTDDVKKFNIKATGDINTAARQVALELFSKVIKRTPVGNPTIWKSVKDGRKPPKRYAGGRARGNWQCNTGVTTTVVATKDKDANGGATIGKVLGVMAGWKPTEGQTIWIGNALPYIIRLEYDAWSSQAVAGMVRVSLLEARVKP
jgi:predicted DNA-binding transcriptional regulator AlpA